MLNSDPISTNKDPSLGTPAGAFKLKPACQYLGGISQITLRRLIARGMIRANRSLRHILIAKTELDRFLAS
jgi:excisionase family DNA binding protein